MARRQPASGTRLRARAYFSMLNPLLFHAPRTLRASTSVH